MKAKIKYRGSFKVGKRTEMRIIYSMEVLKEEKTKNEFQREIDSKLQFSLNENVEET